MWHKKTKKGYKTKLPDRRLTSAKNDAQPLRFDEYKFWNKRLNSLENLYAQLIENNREIVNVILDKNQTGLFYGISSIIREYRNSIDTGLKCNNNLFECIHRAYASLAKQSFIRIWHIIQAHDASHVHHADAINLLSK